jgi:hypothetical protein
MQMLTLLLPSAPGFLRQLTRQRRLAGTTTSNAPKLCSISQTLTCGGSAGLQLYRNSAVFDARLNVSTGSGAPAATTSVSAAAPAATGYTTDDACSASSSC